MICTHDFFEFRACAIFMVLNSSRSPSPRPTAPLNSNINININIIINSNTNSDAYIMFRFVKGCDTKLIPARPAHPIPHQTRPHPIQRLEHNGWACSSLIWYNIINHITNEMIQSFCYNAIRFKSNQSDAIQQRRHHTIFMFISYCNSIQFNAIQHNNVCGLTHQSKTRQSRSSNYCRLRMFLQKSAKHDERMLM